MICTFFGHKNTPASIKPILKAKIKQVTEHYPDAKFYVGHNGSFDSMVISVLKELSENYPGISYNVVLAYLPSATADKTGDFFYDVPSIYPEGIETVPKKYAISFRNEWMIRQADMVICYITHDFGGAAKYAQKARKNKKAVINLADTN